MWMAQARLYITLNSYEWLVERYRRKKHVQMATRDEENSSSATPSANNTTATDAIPASVSLPKG